MLLAIWTRPRVQVPVTKIKEKKQKPGHGGVFSENDPVSSYLNWANYCRLCSTGPCWLGTARAEPTVMEKLLSGVLVLVHGVMFLVSLFILYHHECVLFLQIKTKRLN